MKTALVTGGCGFVGRHLVRRLLSLDYNVCVVDNFYPGSGARQFEHWNLGDINADKLKIRMQDCRDFFISKRDVDVYGEFDEVYHLAAIVGGRMTIEKDPLAVAQDLSIDAEFFHWLSRLDYKPKVCYFSSSAAYGWYVQQQKFHATLKEDFIDFNDMSIMVPDLTYGWSKLTGEYLARICHKVYGHDITCFRPFSGYGEDQDEAYPFISILKRVLAEDNPVEVWGTGNQVRDFIYIEDCIDGIMLLKDHIHDGSGVNLSTGIGTSFNELATLMRTAIHSDENINIQNTATKPEGVFWRVGDTALQISLGFKPKTSLFEGILRAADFLTRNTIAHELIKSEIKST